MPDVRSVQSLHSTYDQVIVTVRQPNLDINPCPAEYLRLFCSSLSAEYLENFP